MIYPMYAMVVLTVVVLLVVFRARVRAVRGRDLSIKYFRSFSGADAPEYALIPARHFTNLFEVPVLFYAVGICAMVMQASGTAMIGLAWAFVFARATQALIHLTYNNVYHRMAAYFAGVVIVVLMWTLLVISVT